MSSVDPSKTTVAITQSNPRVQSTTGSTTGSFGGQNTTGPNVNDPNALGPNVNDPNALGPNVNDLNALGPNVNDPNAIGPNFNKPKARFYYDHPKCLIGFACCCCICCTFFIIPVISAIIALMAMPPNNRIPAPGSVEFGPSRFDVYCNHTYNPQTARPTRQTVGNRSFVTSGLDVHLKSYQYVVFEICRANGVNENTCTGSIIDSRHILTAAHCVSTQTRHKVGAESSDFILTLAVIEIRLGVVRARSKTPADIQHMQVVFAESIYVHSNYDQISEGNTDVALIRLNTSLTFNDYIKPVCLAGPKDELPSECVIVGFGVTGSDNEDDPKLSRAPGVSIYSSDDCSVGELATAAGDQVYEADYNYLPRVYFDLEAKWFLPILFRGQLCSQTGKVCTADSGGPLLCTPKGVVSTKEYHNPSSPLFRQTDPTLKQFGINKGLLRGKCGDSDLISMYMSVKDLRLWLEYVAWPAVQDRKATLTKDRRRFLYCTHGSDFQSLVAATKKGAGKELNLNHHHHICRKFLSYANCADNSPKLEYCDHLMSTILSTIRDFTLYVDLLPFFKQERCRQEANAPGCN